MRGGTDIRVCFFGDSFTLGSGDDTGLGWPGRVVVEARSRGIDLTGYNLGVRGQTGTEIAARAASEIAVRIADRGARQGVVLSFGANDIRLGCTTDESAEAAASIVGWARSQGYKTFMMGAPRAAEPELDALRGQLNLRLARVAENMGAPFLDIRTVLADWSAWHREAVEGDGIHPNAEGYRRVAEVFDAWTPWRDWLGAG